MREDEDAEAAVDGDSVDVMLAELRSEWAGLDVSSSEVVARLLRAAQLLEERFTAQLRRAGGMAVANVGDFDVLHALRRSGPPYALTPGQLRRALVVSSAGLTGRFNRLEREGWIERGPSPVDGRSTLVRLTEEGRTNVDRVLERHFGLERDVLSVLEPGERASVAHALRKLLMSLEDDVR
ncbi:MarR family winged helix-turn-helix transcriptional regulator [Streptomyces fungicidicus]|jgi:DNA-binding MarR family transcriptional regulator|uniref:MarR family transcriptional regulator n=1 Tax=Streptomyces fungicidicus TaxID=68203 RepID=A0A494URW7_9ACTN|nr:MULTISPECIES: MarR family transcriptional regulator [Streptomyces]AYL37593.1 MarR family transcriptional regulator [Streptomyces fungicidicus]QKW01983.1 MarR family transcriptional regulator [Streptomyces sp. NA02536]TQL20871.1 MarR family transcriptional regulator [Streptomyces sp. SLBN-134]